jgi:hypothetical protein
VRAGCQEFRAVDLAGLRHAEPLVCEPVLAQVAPWFSLLSDRHGEGTAAQGFELSSQTVCLFLVCHGYGFGGSETGFHIIREDIPCFLKNLHPACRV